MSLEFEFIDKLQITLKEDLSEKLYLMVTPIVKESSIKGNEIHSRNGLRVEITDVLEQSTLLVTITKEETFGIVVTKNGLLFEKVFLKRFQII